MSCGLGVLPDVTRQQPRGPKFVRISHFLGLLAGQRHHPGAGLVGDRRLLAGPRAVVERRHHAKPHRTIKASLHGLMGHADRLTDCVGRRVGAIGQEDAGPLNPTRPFRSRPRDRLQFDQVSRSDRDLDYPPRCCHRIPPSCCVVPSSYNMWGQPWESGTTGRFHGIDVIARCRDVPALPIFAAIEPIAAHCEA